MSGRRKEILILDNDESVLIGLERILEDEGFETTTTWDTREALDLLDSREFDLLLVGNHPPDVNGAQVLRQLQYRKILAPRLVLLSAAQHPFEAAYFCALGASAVISKWRQRDIAERIRNCLSVSEGKRSGTIVARRAA